MSTCIETEYSRSPRGYGQCHVLRFGRIIWRAHVLAWVDAHGCLPPEDRPNILHTCDNPPCVNVEHLYAGTKADNARDMVDRGRAWNPTARENKAKTACGVCGTPYDEQNTYVNPSGTRSCRNCRRAAFHRAKHLRATRV